MGRLGFKEKDLPELVQVLTQHPDLRVVSIMSHLAAADLPSEDAFTTQQVALFQKMAVTTMIGVVRTV